MGLLNAKTGLWLNLHIVCYKKQKCPMVFWGEAITTTNYLQNKIITKVVAHCIPKEVWTSHKPTMKHLRTFRCFAYAHIVIKLHKKLEAKSQKCQFLEYSSDVKRLLSS